jgi:uncharacterized membrane protein
MSSESSARFVSSADGGNPSVWSKRGRVLGLAAAGLAIAGYLTSYQLGIIASVWDPFFGVGSERVLHSALSRLLPVPDALLGAVGYLADLVLTAVGGSDRARTRPWIVLLLGVVVTTMAVGSGILVFVQILVLRAFCTLCLVSAGLSFAIFVFAWEEVAASLEGIGSGS